MSWRNERFHPDQVRKLTPSLTDGSTTWATPDNGRIVAAHRVQWEVVSLPEASDVSAS